MNVNYASVHTARQLSFYSFYLSLINRISCILYIRVYIYIYVFVAMQFRNHNRATAVPTLLYDVVPFQRQRRFPHAKHVKSLAEDKNRE